ncbi:KAP family P-loop NTPase fold protein [Candidatus Leptofilum sp.]|uniref:KAP family P-loop NTPase fold protein n=1 Tax=Candidatus Leptofilum sp. TaxID=3241576 RepID=UPI003B5B2EAE
MWTDNETNIDFLGFQVHTDLIKSVVTDKSLLPITVGVFGDWGSGKSSVMKMLEHGLQENEQIATIYFNGWQFEGYDEAKSALIYSILIELAEHRRLAPAIKTRVKELIKKVDWVRLASTSYQVAVPFLTSWAAAQTGTPIIPPLLPQPQSPSPPAEAQEQLAENLADVDLAELLKSNPANQAMLGVRQFRKEFSNLIEDTDLEAVIILVDDLDRCEPKRLVETLEAIKLFLTVPHVAFVIGADERIVRHAIAKRYETEDVTQDTPATERQTDLVTDYVEKLIQVPYYLPRLSQSEIETYMSLLFCKQHLEQQNFKVIHQAFITSRSQDITGTFSLQQIQDTATNNTITLPEILIQELTWCSVIAPTLGEFLKGNPRQTKRLLNALVLRRKLAEAAHLENLSNQVLVKLMLLQYLRPRLFAQLYKWQASQNGLPQEINTLEEWVHGNEAEVPETIEQGSNWNNSSIRRWLAMDPPLTSVDLRSYFWITRDRVEGILSGVSAIPRYMRQIILDLMKLEANGIFPKELKLQIEQLPTDEQNILLDELEDKLKRAEEKRNLIWVWDEMLPIMPSASERLIDILNGIPSSNLPSAVPAKVNAIATEYPAIRDKSTELLRKWANEKQGTVARAAQEMLTQAIGGNN